MSKALILPPKNLFVRVTNTLSVTSLLSPSFKTADLRMANWNTAFVLNSSKSLFVCENESTVAEVKLSAPEKSGAKTMLARSLIMLFVLPIYSGRAYSSNNSRVVQSIGSLRPSNLHRAKTVWQHRRLRRLFSVVVAAPRTRRVLNQVRGCPAHRAVATRCRPGLDRQPGSHLY